MVVVPMLGSDIVKVHGKLGGGLGGINDHFIVVVVIVLLLEPGSLRSHPLSLSLLTSLLEEILAYFSRRDWNTTAISQDETSTHLKYLSNLHLNSSSKASRIAAGYFVQLHLRSIPVRLRPSRIALFIANLKSSRTCF